MRLPVPKTIFTAHAVAWLYLAGFVLAEVIYAGLSPRDQAAITTWASTNVHNLSHDPLGSLIASAFVTGAFVTAWPILIALALFGASGVLGSWRYLTDVGPSYVVVSAIVVALLYGSWPTRGAAALGLALLILVGNIFGGLSQLSVPAVGHVTAMIVAAGAGSVLVWRQRARALSKDPAGAGQPG